MFHPVTTPTAASASTTTTASTSTAGSSGMNPGDHRRKRMNEGDDSSGSSTRPVTGPPRKRRKTFLDAFQSIKLEKKKDEEESEEEGNDADSSQAVADAANSTHSTGSSIADDLDDNDDEMLLSDKEKAERKVMLELVFGPHMKPHDIVDKKLQAWVQKSIQEAKQTTTHTTADDMTIDAPYHRSSLPPAEPPESYTRKRSNSLPDMLDSQDMMDTS